MLLLVVILALFPGLSTSTAAPFLRSLLPPLPPATASLEWLHGWLAADPESASLFISLAQHAQQHTIPRNWNGRTSNSTGDRAVLEAIYEEGGGADWRDERARGSWGSGVSHCKWTGVTCDNSKKVTRLFMGNFGLTTLSERIGELDRLETLSVRGNGLEALPEGLGAIRGLETLLVSSNRLTRLPGSMLRGSSALTYLDIGENLFDDLSPLCSLRSLDRLRANSNLLTTVPDCLARLPVIYLVLESNLLRGPLPVGLCTMATLQYLEANDNQISGAVPEGCFASLSALKTLHLQNNQIESLPAGFFDGLASLEGLFLSGNRLRGLPAFGANLSRLEVLALSNNRLQTLPSLSGLTSLREALLEFNALTSLPDGFEKLLSLVVLRLASNRFVQIPPSISLLPQLMNLTLDTNGLTSLHALPPTLIELTADSNKIALLPSSVGSLTRLLKLSLADNRLVSVPSQLSQFTRLKVLNLKGNLLTAVPPLDRLLALVDLQLESNRLVRPPSLGALRSLQRLTLGDNPMDQDALASLSLASLTELRELSLSNLGLRTLPPFSLDKLRRLDLNGNRLSGTAALCSETLRVLNVNSNPSFEGVVVVVDSASGNSSSACLPALESVNLARCNVTSVLFLAGSLSLVDLDISHNPALGNSPFELVKESWPSLRSLRAENISAQLAIADALASVTAIKSLLSLNLAFNPGIEGSLDALSFAAARNFSGVESSDDDSQEVFQNSSTSNLGILRLDGTSISFFESKMALYLPSVRVLSLSQIPSLESDVPFNKQKWLFLEDLDLRSSNAELNAIARPVEALPGALEVVDIGSFSVCPSRIVGGLLSQFSISVGPELYGRALCRCLAGYFGQPERGCQVCPAVPPGEGRSLAVDCTSVPGRLLVTGGSLVFDRAARAVSALACPSDSPRSPCRTSELWSTVLDEGEWEAAAPVPVCEDGYEGRLCSRCKAGFFRSGRGCLRCGARSLSWLNPVWSIIVLTALGVKTVVGGYAGRNGLIRTLTMHAQLVALLPGMSLRLAEWSAHFVQTAASGSGGLRLNGLECQDRGWDGFYGPFVQAGLLPVLVALGSAWIALVSGLVSKQGPETYRSRLVLAGLYLWFVLLFGSMQKLMAPLNCTDYGSEASGKRFLTAALWIACDSGSSYRGLLAASIVFGLGYIVVSVAYMVYRLRPSSQGSSPVSVFLRSPYRADCYYWEVVQLVRRIALAMASSLSKIDSPLQPVIVSSVLLLGLVAHTSRKPYALRVDNTVESISLTLLLSSYIAGLIASNPRFPASATTAISWLFFAVNALFLLSLTVAVLFFAIEEMRRDRKKNANKVEEKEMALLDEE
jgi:Leucine-rich repeat (LRR) protein